MKIKNKKNFLLILLEAVLIVLIGMFLPSMINAGVGEGNVTVQTTLLVGNVYPEVLNVSISDTLGSISLSPNSTTQISCEALVRDFNGDNDIVSVNARFFDTNKSNWGDSDDNNEHYTNSSCSLSTSFSSWNGISDDAYLALANCTFNLQYYSNAANWNCSVIATDTRGWTDSKNDSTIISELLALGLPDSINYGEVNATEVSLENLTNVYNYGNVPINLSLSGYAQTEGDGYAMNCSLGGNGFISVNYEKYNLTASTPGTLVLSEFENVYNNLTATPKVKAFNLNSRQNDLVNDAYAPTYWRIYVPRGVAGTCQGNIVFGAVQANEI